MTSWRRRLFLKAQRLAVGVEFHHAVALWISNLISENAGAPFNRERIPKEIEFSVENVVSKDQCGAGFTNEFRTDQERLRNSFWLGLLGILQTDSKLFTGPEEVSQHGQILGGGDDQDFTQTAKH